MCKFNLLWMAGMAEFLFPLEGMAVLGGRLVKGWILNRMGVSTGRSVIAGLPHLLSYFCLGKKVYKTIYL